jgi:hypothetical protein
MQKFKLYVGTSKNDLRLLKFIQSNTQTINQMGVGTSITHIKKRNMNSELVEMLHKKGISRLPVLIAGGKKFIGLKRIIGLFKNNINNFNNSTNESMHQMNGTPAMMNTDGVESYMNSIMDEGEDDMANDDADDMMRQYANATTGRGGDQNKQSVRVSAPTNLFEDNDMSDMGSSTRPDDDNISVLNSLSQTSGGDNLDMQMENAYWNNQTSSESVLDF